MRWGQCPHTCIIHRHFFLSHVEGVKCFCWENLKVRVNQHFEHLVILIVFKYREPARGYTLFDGSRCYYATLHNAECISLIQTHSTYIFETKRFWIVFRCPFLLDVIVHILPFPIQVSMAQSLHSSFHLRYCTRLILVVIQKQLELQV